MHDEILRCTMDKKSLSNSCKHDEEDKAVVFTPHNHFRDVNHCFNYWAVKTESLTPHATLYYMQNSCPLHRLCQWTNYYTGSHSYLQVLDLKQINKKKILPLPSCCSKPYNSLSYVEHKRRCQAESECSTFPFADSDGKACCSTSKITPPKKAR